MKDRFKFRVWHEPLKQMYYNDFIVTSTGYTAKLYQENDYMMKFNQEDLELDKQCIVMQCTGLKDKNSKLIYEGDIVKFGEFYDEWHSFHIGKVYWGEEYSYPAFEIQCSTYDFDTCNGLSYIFCEGLSIEVIGNIYENIDLLEERN